MKLPRLQSNHMKEENMKKLSHTSLRAIERRVWQLGFVSWDIKILLKTLSDTESDYFEQR